MKRNLWFLILFALLTALVFPGAALAADDAAKIPTFSIQNVVKDTSVTIYTYNFPANTSFDVLMNVFGTRGLKGIKVGTLNSGAGGSLTASFNIPDALKGEKQIAIRTQANNGSGYFAYNWFYNNRSGSNSGNNGNSNDNAKIPTFSILSVLKDSSVKIRTSNFPANDSFDVLMNYMGTRGVKGVKVATVNSGSGGSFDSTFDIPASLKGERQIAIRLQSNTGSGYFAYNWFYNNTAGSNSGGQQPGTGYAGYPTFTIHSVVRNQTVTIQVSNLPKNDTFNVRMGEMGTGAVNGHLVDSFNSGSGGSQTFTFDIPAQLKGARQIAIRIESTSGSGYFAYNWFYNSTT